VHRSIPAFSLACVLVAYSQSLPWPWIYSNPQFPAYAEQREDRMHACELLSGTNTNAPVMVSMPAEIHLASGHPAVLLPTTHDIPSIDALRRRYGVRFLLATRHELAPLVSQRLALRSVAGRFGYVLYEFPAAATVIAGSPTGAGLDPAPENRSR